MCKATGSPRSCGSVTVVSVANQSSESLVCWFFENQIKIHGGSAALCDFTELLEFMKKTVNMGGNFLFYSL